MTLDRAISSLEMQLASARAAKTQGEERSPVNAIPGSQLLNGRRKVFFVMGIITAFSSRKRRDSIRKTWVPQGDELRKLEKDKGVVIRFVIGRRHILHRYANEDVSLGSWFIGLDIEHFDDRSLCCGTPPDCEWKAEAGNVCAASFDWSCSGICKSVERMEEAHQCCGEGDGAIWQASF